MTGILNMRAVLMGATCWRKGAGNTCAGGCEAWSDMRAEGEVRDNCANKLVERLTATVQNMYIQQICTSHLGPPTGPVEVISIVRWVK